MTTVSDTCKVDKNGELLVTGDTVLVIRGPERGLTGVVASFFPASPTVGVDFGVVEERFNNLYKVLPERTGRWQDSRDVEKISVVIEGDDDDDFI